LEEFLTDVTTNSCEMWGKLTYMSQGCAVCPLTESSEELAPSSFWSLNFMAAISFRMLKYLFTESKLKTTLRL
jgi:hypothetical protein